MNNKTIDVIREKMEKLSDNSTLIDAYAKSTAYRCEGILRGDNPEKDEDDKLLINQYSFIILKETRKMLRQIENIINNK